MGETPVRPTILADTLARSPAGTKSNRPHVTRIGASDQREGGRARLQAFRTASTTAFAWRLWRLGSAESHATDRATPSANGTVARKSGTKLRILLLSKTRLQALSPSRLAPRRASRRATKSEGTCTSSSSAPTASAIVA